MGKTRGADNLAGVKFPLMFTEFASGATNTNQDIQVQTPDYIKVEAVRLRMEAAMTGAATNYPKMSLVNRGTNGVGTTEIAAISFNATSVVCASAGYVDLTLSTIAANLLLTPGEILSAVIAQQASGKVYPICQISIGFSFS
jgi:hypothetical protein